KVSLLIGARGESREGSRKGRRRERGRGGETRQRARFTHDVALAPVRLRLRGWHPASAFHYTQPRSALNCPSPGSERGRRKPGGTWRNWNTRRTFNPLP